MASTPSSTFEDTQRRLAELERLIAQVCPRSETPSEHKGGKSPGQFSAQRPSSARPHAGYARPQSGNARPQSARQSGNVTPQSARPQSGNGRPQSARSARPQSASSAASLHRSQSGGPSPAQNQAEQAAILRKKKMEFQNLLDLVGHKAATKFKTIHACFRTVHRANTGTMDRDELGELFRSFNLQDEFADRFMDHMDPEKTGEIEFSELQQIIGQYIQPGYKARPSSKVERNDAGKSVEQRKREAELQQLAEIIGAKAHAKYRCLRDCFRFVDEDKDGTVSRTECLRFMEVFGFPHAVGDHVYDLLLDKSGHSGEVDFKTFLNTFGPYIQPGYAAMYQAPSPADGPGPYASREGSSRPQSARAQRPAPGGAATLQRSKSHRPASADGRKADDWGSVASTMPGSASVKTCSASSASSVASSAGRQFRRASHAFHARQQQQRKQSGAARPKQAAAPRKNQRAENWSRNFDSSNLKHRVYYQKDEGGQQSSMARLSHHGPVFQSVDHIHDSALEMEDPHAQREKQEKMQPRRPSHSPARPRPHTAKVRREGRSAATPRHHRSVEVSASKCMLGPGEDSRSTCAPGTPRETRLRHQNSAARLQKEYKYPNSTTSLCSSLEQQWSVIA